MIGRLALKANVEDAYTVAKRIADDSGLYMFYKLDTSIEGQSRTANVEELVDSVSLFIEEKKNEYAEDLIAEGQISDGSDLAESDYPVVTLCDYLENASLLSAVDVSDEESSNKIALMTAHSSKGLEFPYVFVAGMEENIFPSGGFMASESEIEEERRLFYVAMTRARKTLYISYVKEKSAKMLQKSRFLLELMQK